MSFSWFRLFYLILAVLRPFVTTLDSTEVDIEITRLLSEQREILYKDLSGFKYPGNKSLADFSPEMGGRPINNIIITTWRSGSSFFGDILKSLPGTFYHYEPLIAGFYTNEIRSQPKAAKAVKYLKNLLNCDFGWNNGEYLKYAMENRFLFGKNKFFSEMGVQNERFWYDPKFLTPFCRMFPWHSMKLIRLRMSLAEGLLQDQDLNIRLVLLVRDPRGTMHSRRNLALNWCRLLPHCYLASHLCEDLVNDYSAAMELMDKYPGRVKIVRYEDVAVDPRPVTAEIFKFLGFPLEGKVEDFLDKHTKANNHKGDYSTSRNSRAAAFSWTKELPFDEIRRIQENCDAAMSLYGYKLVANRSMLENEFDPLLKCNVSITDAN